MPPKADSVLKTEMITLPSGFTFAVDKGGNEYITPQYLIPDLHHIFMCYRKKQIVGVEATPPWIGKVDEDLETDAIAGGLFTYPANPILSDQERLSAHSEVLALQEQFGISYKDASHRLYMAELEKLKVLDKHCKALANLSSYIQDMIENPDPDRQTGEENRAADEQHT